MSDYLKTVERREPDVWPIDITGGAASIAISLQRIANALALEQLPNITSVCSTDASSETAMFGLRKRLLDEYLLVNGMPYVIDKS